MAARMQPIPSAQFRADTPTWASPHQALPAGVQRGHPPGAVTACKKHLSCILPHSASILLISRWFSRQAPGYQDGGAPSRGQRFTISTSELPHPASHVILTTREARGFHSMTIPAGPVRCWAPGQLSQTDRLPISRSLRPPGCPGGESIAKWLSDLPRARSQYQSTCLPSLILTQVPSSTS